MKDLIKNTKSRWKSFWFFVGIGWSVVILWVRNKILNFYLWVEREKNKALQMKQKGKDMLKDLKNRN